MMKPKSVYIHIPFCEQKCHYCDFNTYVLKGQPVDDYLDSLDREMAQTVEALPHGEIETIFVGGGTPTALTPMQMSKFLKSVAEYFPFQGRDIEFTMEANPGRADIEKLDAMKSGGVNRISFGVQSFDDALLQSIGRIHRSEEVYRCIDNARSIGFDNISIDLMFGLPNQTLEGLDESIAKALALKLPHYSIYALKIEENTPFHSLYMKNALPLPDEDEEAEMYELLIRRMKEAGYVHYEISNFALPSFESKHNTTYWRNEPYYGIGAGAHGYADGIRHVNVKGVQPYIDACKSGLPRLTQFSVSREEAMEDFMMVGLRLLQGIRKSDFYAQFGSNVEERFGEALEQLIRLGLLEEGEEGYRLTERGVFFGNDVFARFVS